MTVYRNTAEGGPQGENVTISNSGGLSGDPFSIVNEGGVSDILFDTAAGLHGPKGIRIVPDGTNQTWVGYTFPALRLNTVLRFYFRFLSFPLAGGVVNLVYWANTSNTGQRLAVRVSPSGTITISNAAVQIVWTGSVPLQANTIYRMEVAAGIGVGTITFRVYAGENAVPITGLTADLTSQAIGGTSGAAHILLGYRTIVVGAGVLHIDEIMINDDSLELLGPAGKAEIPLSVDFVGGGVVRLAWPIPSDAPNGITVARAPGLQVADGNGNPVHHPEYNPMTIQGATMIATNVMTSPYNDTGVPLGSWTYWIARTAP